MFTIIVEILNSFNQRFYDSIISNLRFDELTCECGHSGCLTIHGYYSRYVQEQDEKLRIKITRVKCSVCGKTHALLMSSLVPYSQIPLENQREIIVSHEDGESVSQICDDHPQIDENSIKAVIQRFKLYWKDRLISKGISLSSPGTLIRCCFENYSAQFMQNRNTAFNRLYLIPT